MRPAASSSRFRSAAANERAATSASREIRAVLSAAGVPGHSIEMQALSRPQDPVRLGTHPGELSEDGGRDRPLRPVAGGSRPDDERRVHTSNRPHWNHGCATQRNLAAQVAEPADLVQPRAETPVLTSRRATAVDKYRKGEATATQYPDANKGKISDVGQ